MTKNKREEFILPYQAHVDDHPEHRPKSDSDINEIFNELRRLLTITHEHHGDLKKIRKLMNQFDNTAYGSNTV